MKSSLISCIVPVFNGEKYLGEALETILKQTYGPVEIIVVDDGSSDRTAAVAARYGNRIRYVRQNKSGAPTARNFGLSLAEGEFVAFLDADDLWHPGKLDLQVACLKADPAADLCITHVQNFWIPELKKEAESFREHRLTRPVPGYVTQALLARRALFDRVGRFNSAIQHGDAQDWFLRAAERGAIMKLLSDVLVYRRLHRSNFSRHVSAALDDHLGIVKASLDRRRRGDTSVQVYDFPGSSPETKTKQ